ncbi:hypothetical protein K3727_17230 [Rhodobacteraceae bacterium M382]|nr:hypothetical protein K3727_17230 [Rhodobacteraceae bacterium M382]
MSKRDLAEKLEKIIKDIGDDVLNDQRVATEIALVRKTYDALNALVELHNDLDPVEKLTLE